MGGHVGGCAHGAVHRGRDGVATRTVATRLPRITTLVPRLRSAGGFTVGELLIVIVIVGVLAAAAVALLQQARMSGNETSAIASMRTIVQGQAAYSAFNNGYAGSIQALATLCSGMKVGFISPEINANGVVKTGYVLNLVPGTGADQATTDCNGRADAYQVLRDGRARSAGRHRQARIRRDHDVV